MLFEDSPVTLLSTLWSMTETKSLLKKIIFMSLKQLFMQASRIVRHQVNLKPPRFVSLSYVRLHLANPKY